MPTRVCLIPTLILSVKMSKFADDTAIMVSSQEIMPYAGSKFYL